MKCADMLFGLIDYPHCQLYVCDWLRIDSTQAIHFIACISLYSQAREPNPNPDTLLIPGYGTI